MESSSGNDTAAADRAVPGGPLSTTRSAYDAVAESYARLLPDLSAEEPTDRAMISAFAEHVAASASRQVLDAGCGTGRLIPTLERLGLTVTGIDLSPAMIAVARAANPTTRLAVADLGELPFADGEFDGVIAWYSLIHTSDEDLPSVAAELSRVLRPGGFFLTGFQSGSGIRHIEHAYGHDVELTAYLHSPSHIRDVFENVGLEHVAVCERAPASERHPQAFVLARKSATNVAGAREHETP